MKKKYVLIQGTIILTLAGFITRIIGFFYRIFLAQTIGAEGMGIYQLIFPIYGMCFSFTAAGIQTAISRSVAAKISVGDEKAAKDIFSAGLCISLFLSVITSIFLYYRADWLASAVLEEERCAQLLQILAITIPFGAVHSCVNGYYYGLKKANIPALAQLLEQLVRVLSTYIVYQILKDNGQVATPALAVIGIVIGEFFSMLYNGTMILGRFGKKNLPRTGTISFLFRAKQILTISTPLSANRILVNVLQSAEAILIPIRLRMYGYNVSESLSVYGIFNGMALPLILFPSAITNSVAVMLMPAIAEAQATGNERAIARTVENTIKYCLVLGILCTGIFLTFGDEMGTLFYQNEMAGKFILILGWICPFLYLTTTLTSILNGLGKTTSSFIHNCVGLSIRILFVLFCIPKFGIIGYLWGLLLSELLLTIMCIHDIRKCTTIRFVMDEWLVKPLLCLGAGIGGALLVQSGLTQAHLFTPLIQAGLSFTVLCILYAIFLILFGILKLPVDN